MKLFCDNCDNKLNISIENEQLYYKCINCFAVYKSEDDDTLIYEKIKNNNINIYENILNNANEDILNLKEFTKCPKCKNHISKTIRIGNELRLINICEKCEFKWIKLE